MIFITDELGKFEKNIIELAENMGFKECKTIEAIDLFCGISEKNDVLKEKDRYYAFIDIPQYWSVRADGLNGAIYDNKTKKANIYFKNPIEKRMVSRVEWIDRNNTVYRIDYYNKYGYMYCSENVSGGNVTVREFYDRNGDIKVLEQTGPKTYTTFGTRISPKSYRGFADYLEAYLKYNKIYDENIWLTSDEILNKFAWDYGNFKISYLPQNRLNSDLTVITQTNTAFRILCSEEQQVNWYKDNSNCKCDRLYSYLENNKSKFGKKEAFIITETDQLEYIEQLYNWDNDSSDGLNPERRIFWNKQGQMVYEQCIYKDNVEYLFKNGEVIDNVAFVERFIKELNLCENDICIMDRAGYLDYIQPLFENKGKSKLIAVLHSDHFYKIYEDESSLYMNYEYYYWFKYSEAIDYFVVGTDEHKRSLEAFLKEYDCFVPHIAAIPPGAIPEGKIKSKNNRWRGSIISASRLSPRKGIDILIKSVIKAHEINQTINLDIYGSGNDEYTSYLQNIVKDACADDYIHFKGRCNLEKIYPHYELFASFSLWETFGLSLMEAVGDGLAMVGLDVRYGNRLFIHQDENGYLVDFDIETDFQNKDKLCERTAAAIVKIFEDDDRLKKFHENSYMIAEEYKEHVIESKWMQLIKNILDLNPSNLIL